MGPTGGCTLLHLNVNLLPQTPEELLDTLFRIFPEYRTRYPGPIHDYPPSYHSVLISFTPFFGAELTSFSKAQLRSFGNMVSKAVAQGGQLENAFGTCFLEHLHHIRAERAMRTYLSKAARQMTHA